MGGKLDPNHVSLSVFSKLLKSLSLLLRIDEVFVRYHFLWCATSAFEMPDALFAELLWRCLNRLPAVGCSIEEEPFSRTDLSRFSNAAGILDFSGTGGIPLGALDLMYQECVRKMPDFLERRVQKLPASKLLGERNALAG